MGRPFLLTRTKRREDVDSAKPSFALHAEGDRVRSPEKHALMPCQPPNFGFV